jgi:disaggregatase-related protein/fibronectin type III domain protein/TGF-beta propeptide
MQYPSPVRLPEVTSRKLVVFLFAFLLSSAARTSAASTYYLATNGSDLNPGTSSAPWQTFSKAWSLMAPGDTLIVRSGRYYQSISPTISGTAGSPLTIKAEVDGGAILDGQGARSGIQIFSNPPTIPTRQYITIEGFRVENSGERPAVQVSSQDGTPLSGQSNNIIIRRTGARGDAMSSNNPVWEIARARDSLLEDVWGWRYGRYVVNVYGCTRITVRRGVFRWDGWGQGANKPGDPKFNMGVYDTHDSLFENVLLLDAANDLLGGDKGGLYLPGNSNGTTAPYDDTDNNAFKGIISLNNIGHGVGVEGGSGGTNDNNHFVDLVSWGNSGVGVTVPRKDSGTSFDHVTVGENDRGFYFGHDYDNVTGTLLKNSLVYSNTNDGINGPASTSYNNVFANGANYNGGASAGTNTISQDPRLDYILRIESDSPDKGTAADGGDRGATVVKRYVDGTLAAVNLWPWPHEGRIRNDLCESTSRGLCDPFWSSLTDYVWRQLGHPWPGGGDTFPPTAPTNPILANPTSTTLDFSWSASTDDVAVAGYRVDVATDASFTSFVAGYESRDVGNVTQKQITGLAPETTYYAQVRAYDAAGNTSPDSATVSAATTTGPSCLTATFSSAQWQNQSFDTQTGRFMAEVDVTPSVSNVDAAVSVSSGPQTTWDGLAATVLFYTDGLIKARNGAVYTAGTVAYTGGATYHVRMEIDLASHTYSAFVTPAGGTEQVIGTNLAFRNGQETVTVLDDWTVSSDAGSLTACGFTTSALPPLPPPQTQVFQQGLNGYTGVADTWINSYDPNLNFNGEIKLSVLGYEDIKALVRFDLSSIPVGTTITSATLSLYNYAHYASATGGALSVYPVSRPWVESEATWNRYAASGTWTAPGMQAGTDYSISPSTSITIDTSTDVWRTFDVTAIVQDWLNGTRPNNGFVVRSPTNGVKPLFYSSGFTTDPSLRPKLKISY